MTVDTAENNDPDFIVYSQRTANTVLAVPVTYQAGLVLDHLFRDRLVYWDNGVVISYEDLGHIIADYAVTAIFPPHPMSTDMAMGLGGYIMLDNFEEVESF